MTNDALKDAKRSVRERILAQRHALDPQIRQRLSAAITARLLALPEYLSADTIAAYVSINSEFDTRAFLADAASRGKQCLLPRIDQTRRAIDLWRVADLERDLLPGIWGIREPDPARCERADPGKVGFILVPGVAFTPQGARLGYGGGYYDGLLSRVPAALKVAAAFPLQILDSLPTGPRDFPVDLVVTDAAIYDASNRSGGAAAHT
ncbi:MAG: 5-formyltetrahydrofolate cyclo-ligase [Burkholderiales bacterium]